MALLAYYSNTKLVYTTSFLIFLISFSSNSLASENTTSTSSPTSPVTPKSLCQTTPDPSYCRSVLPSNGTGTENAYDYGRYSFRKSLSQARKFKALIDKHLRQQRSRQLSAPAVRALEDCSLLAGLNMDFLLASSATVGETRRYLSDIKAEDVHTLLSAIVTNQQTCLDGIQASASAWSLKNGISIPLKNDTKLYSVSLALFTKAWLPKRKPAGSIPKRFRTSRLPNRAVLETAMMSRRKVMQLGGGDGDDDVVEVRETVTVSQDGTGNFTSINDAVSAAPNNSVAGDGYFLIYVKAGVYEEYVSIAKNKRYLMMIGDGINKTVISGNRSFVDGWTTFNSATFAVVAPGFVAVNLTIRNTAGAIKHQAVALRSGADLSAFYNCSFEGYQDTLYAHSLRQFYRDCDVYGTVDFVFGNAAVVFQNCNFYPRLPLPGQFNAVTAQGRSDPNQNTAISIHNCTVRAADDLAASNGTTKTYLGRPWKEYSRTVFMQSYIDASVEPAGWREWNGDFALSTLYYAEYDNAGPGSDTSGRVGWDGFHVVGNVSDVANFTVLNFLLGDDWLPQTGVPYSSGLL